MRVRLGRRGNCGVHPAGETISEFCSILDHPATTAWRVFRLGMQEMTSRYGG